ncbi:MAG: isoprenyl transferase [Xanthomonadales bacterium]|nr:isoprenyl transferase [Xanthomonadales bacterium]NIN59302.1 isoprenyl transferase [Xanthomonadales bacterium]NIN74664.1 isoprenyl transferase [Xanthomonadales bacterium]NIO13330.1 isoprenyl transferase [Xanthomonadales bacterium]NIP11695.1 isoprenyl transferase [Xanthomonadales bacterium]
MPTVPEHIAIVMDGNGRWAERRKRPRTFGHQAGLKALRRTTEHCARIGVRTLTVFAFSSENWNRPEREIKRLMELFMRALDKEVSALHENGVRVRFIGDRHAFPGELQMNMRQAEALTASNQKMTLVVAANYGGRWDIVQAAQALARQVATGQLLPEDVDHDRLAARLALADTPDPDLLIRTGGEMRISNFLLWQAAYAELYFTEVLWPDFGAEDLDRAITAYQGRERRFGLTGQQVRGGAGA